MGSNDNTYDDRSYYRRSNNDSEYIKKQVQEAIEEEIMAQKIKKEFVTPMASSWSIVPDVYLGEPEQWEFLKFNGEWDEPARGQKFYDGISSVLELPRDNKDEYRYFIGWLHGSDTLSLRRMKK